MGISDAWKSWRRERIIKAAIAQGLTVPSKRDIRRGRILHWMRGDYTLHNSELLFSAVSRISNALSSMPVQLYKGASPVADDLNDLVAFQPNPNMSASTFFKTMEACRCTSGNAYAMKVFGPRGNLERLEILDPSRVTPILERDSGELWYRITPEQESSYYVHGYYMIHVPFISTNGYSGVNPVSVLQETMDYAANIQSFSVSQLEKGVNAAIIVEAPANLGKDQRDEAVNDLLETYHNSSGNILMLESGLTAKTLNLSPVDSKLFEVEKITRSKVAMVYNLPPHLLGDYSDTSFTSQEQQMLEFLMLTMLPIVTAYEQELDRKLLTGRQRRRGLHFKFDMEAILRADAATQAEVDYKAVRSGWKTPDEIRYNRHLPPFPGGIGAKALVSQDLATLEYTVLQKPAVLAKQPLPGAETGGKEEENGTD